MNGLQMSPTPTDFIAGTRGRVYSLIDAFEIDIKMLLQKYVTSELGADKSLGDLLEKATQRQAQEEHREGLSHPLVHYLDLREAYDILNRHRLFLPTGLADEVRANTSLMDRLVSIRRRVAHARPLAPGDPDSTFSILSSFQTHWWQNLDEQLKLLRKDPTWEPLEVPTSDDSPVLHNLPSAEFDETGLVGRTREVDELISLLKRGREPIITIIGEGGVGKTALAVQVSYQLADDPGIPFEAILWASLKTTRLTTLGIHNISGASTTVVDSLSGVGVALGIGAPPSLSELSAALEGIRALLVIDNLETVGTHEFRELYDALPTSVQFLVTSRIGIGELERRFTLPALSTKDAVALFNAYARSRRQDFLLSRSKPGKEGIVAALRNSPLAIQWYVLSVEAGRDPLLTIRNQDDLLVFCVQSVYAALSASSREALNGLRVLGSAASIDDLVLLLDRPSEPVVVAVQELLRSSLVRREKTTDPDALRSVIRVTESADRFLKANPHDDGSMETLSARNFQIKKVEERRSIEAANRSLAPIVIRVRDERDVAAAHILRDAAMKSQDQDSNGALELIERAKEIAPDFWEIYRVEGYVLGYSGKQAAANFAFQHALQLASHSGEAQAAVSHFYAGFMARQMQDSETAVELERQAHSHFQSAETAHALGNYLVWAGQHQEGIPLLESAIEHSEGKLHLIATSACAEAWARYSELTARDLRNPLKAANMAWKGYKVARTLFSIGVSDNRLMDTATESGTTAARQMRIGLHDGISFDDFDIDLAQLAQDSIRLATTARFSRLEAEMSALVSELQDRGISTTDFETLGENRIRSLEETADTQHVGHLMSIQFSYAFISCDAFPENVFLHSSSCHENVTFTELVEGMLVGFDVELDESGRVRATRVVRV